MEIEEIKEIPIHTEPVPDLVKLEENDNQPQGQDEPKNKKIKISAFKCNRCGKKFSILRDLVQHIQQRTCSSLQSITGLRPLFFTEIRPLFLRIGDRNFEKLKNAIYFGIYFGILRYIFLIYSY